MKEIKSVTIFTGKNAFSLDLSNYTKVVENCLEYESSVSLCIDFYIGDKLVRRIWNPSCDIQYKE